MSTEYHNELDHALQHPKTVPIEALLLDRANLELAVDSIHKGRFSQTEGPLEVVHLPQVDRYELVNGYHRLVEAIGNRHTEVPIRVTRTSIHPPSPEHQLHPDPDERFYGLESLSNGWLLRKVFGR